RFACPLPSRSAAHSRWGMQRISGSACSRLRYPQRQDEVMRISYLICYDICDDKRLRKVFQTMRGYGDHLQFSIFECQLTASDLARCRADLSAIINHKEDQVLFVNLGPAEGRGDRVIVALGKPYTAVDAPCII